MGTLLLIGAFALLSSLLGMLVPSPAQYFIEWLREPSSEACREIIRYINWFLPLETIVSTVEAWLSVIATTLLVFVACKITKLI